MQVKQINILTAIVQYCDQITVNSIRHHEGMDGDIIEKNRRRWLEPHQKSKHQTS